MVKYASLISYQVIGFKPTSKFAGSTPCNSKHQIKVERIIGCAIILCKLKVFLRNIPALYLKKQTVLYDDVALFV